MIYKYMKRLNIFVQSLKRLNTASLVFRETLVRLTNLRLKRCQLYGVMGARRQLVGLLVRNWKQPKYLSTGE